MKEPELKNILRQNFNFEANWKPLFSLLFSKVQYFSNPSNPFSENEKVKSGKQTGIVKLDDGKSIAIFEVEVDDSIHIDKNRQGLREIAIKHIDQNITHGAFVFFYSKNQADYRFSFIAKWSELDLDTGEFKKGETKPKRYTYLLGDNEACTTAAKRLLILIEKKDNQNTGIKEIIDAFSVESLNKEFFKTYKEHYEKFWKFIANPANGYRNILLDTTKEQLEKQEKPIRDFAKKLLGRIVFLHFLQKKGWMGCSANTKKWENGEKQFMQNLFADFSDKPHFHSQCLTKLFFNTLNTRRPNDIFEINGLNGKLNGSRVPYLNGGLFDADKPEEVLKIDFPEKYFAELLEFFEQYNFTIDENSPDDHEVGIDPEMLGHIFENLLEENREKGAFYTPKEVVQYMCKESIVQYLKNSPPLEGWSKTGVVNRPSKNYFELPYNPKLKDRARELRKAGNLSEVLFWNQIKNKQFKGFDFDRQKIVGNYIVDFFCTNCNVAIEIDKSSHDDKQDYDADRDAYLQSLGLTVIHIPVNDVMKNMNGVMEMLHNHPALSGTPPKEGNWEKDIESFIRFHTVSPLLAEKGNAVLINKKLDEIKVCDPAIGSGAFPIGILQEIFEAKKFIYPYLKTNKEFNPAQVKKDIIQKSIYGVDLEKGAVDIAQLRFWLALVVDEENPHPLPNLDYKIMQGNSLLESFEGIDLSKAALFDEPKVRIIEPDLFRDPEANYGFSDKNRNDIKQLIQIYFTTEDKLVKAEIRKQIDKIVTEHIDKSLEGYENRLLIEIAGLEETLKRHKEFLHKSDKTEKEIEKRQKQLEQKGEARKKLLAFEHTDERPYFLWHLFFMDVFDPSTGSGGGFDIIIGNPPYIQLQNNGGALAKQFENLNFETFARTGDIYALFYEKGINLLQNEGLLTFITSNKWMRAGYGEKLRNYFLRFNPKLLIDLGPGVFESATVDTNILTLQKSKVSEYNLKAVSLNQKQNSHSSIENQLSEFGVTINKLTKDAWTISGDIEMKIKEKIERIGIPLKDWDIKIYRGVLTGFNEAFIIDGKKKDELIAQDPKSAEIIKPILRGRDIKRYKAEFADLWIIFIPWHFPLHKDPNISGNSKKAEEAFQKEYPAIYNHLLKYKSQLSKRNKEETGIRYEWYALQRCANTYLEEFEKEKVVWNRIAKEKTFSLVEKGMLIQDSMHFFTGSNLEFLNAILNSKLINWNLNLIIGCSVGGNAGNSDNIRNLPIPQISPEEQKPFIELVDKILAKKENNEDTTAEEQEIDIMVYKLYDLTEEEIAIIENNQ